MKYHFDEVVERISDKCRKWDYDYICSRYGLVPKDFIPFWIADMDFKSAPEIQQQFLNIVQHGTFGYTYCFDEFYEAVIQFQRRRHQVQLQKEWITLSYGTVSTLHYLIQAFCQSGDSVLVNTPVYDPFASAVERQGVTLLKSPLLCKAQRYYLNFEEIEALFVSQKPKVYLFCSPHNPSGRIWHPEEIQKVAELCLKHNVLLVVDEVHSEHILQGEFYPALRLKNDLLNHLIVLTSPNKAFNLGGLKTSYSMIPNEEIRATFRARLEKNSITSPNIFGVWGIVSAYNYAEPWLDALIDYLRENVFYFNNFIETHLPQLQVMPVESSYLAWVNIQKTGMNADEFTAKLAREIGILVENGNHFIADGSDYVRFNLGTPRIHIEKALQRMQDVL